MTARNCAKSTLCVLGFLLLLALAGCGDDGGGSALGSLSVSLTDAPACGFDQVNVTVDKVRVHQSSAADPNAAGWTTIALLPPRKINLLDLNDPTQPNLALEQLGVTPLGAGSYTQIRFVLMRNSGASPPENSVVLSGTNLEVALDTPSAVQSGIKLIHPFTVNPGQRTDLLLDFDACKSIVKAGNSGKYILKPVIKIIPFELNGIEGFVDTNLLSSNVVVSAQLNGEIIRSAVPNSNPSPDPNRGKFFLARLDPGDYDVVITADNHATAVISGVPVPNSTSITTISNQAQPFQLDPSGFQTVGDTVTLINPPAPPAPDDRDDATVIVTAKQTLLVGGPTVTVRSQVATVNDGMAPVGDYTYGLFLPTAAPSLASYGTGILPITPTSTGQNAVAGVYTVHGSAQTPTTTYATQDPAPASVNISGGDRLDQDFTLAP
jgi:hypothetical protein